MYLVFDTETSGFPNPKVANTSAAQARVIQLAAILFDENWNEVASLYEYLYHSNPNFKITEGAYQAHKINMDMLRDKGKIPSVVMESFRKLVYKADHIIAHNFNFDDTMIFIEAENLLTEEAIKDFKHQWSFMNVYCTMELTTAICKLPFATKRTFGKKYKWPKLEEVLKIICGEELAGAHDALNDCRATAKIFKKLLETKVVTLSPILNEKNTVA